MKDEIVKLLKEEIEKLNNIIENNITDSDLKSDLDMLVNSNGSHDLSLTTLLSHLENLSLVKESYKEMFEDDI
jgi:hypothetical protein